MIYSIRQRMKQSSFEIFIQRIDCLIDKFKIKYKLRLMIITEENKMAKIAVNKSLLKEYQTNEDSRVGYMNDNTGF